MSYGSLPVNLCCDPVYWSKSTMAHKVQLSIHFGCITLSGEEGSHACNYQWVAPFINPNMDHFYWGLIYWL